MRYIQRQGVLTSRQSERPRSAGDTAGVSFRTRLRGPTQSSGGVCGTLTGRPALCGPLVVGFPCSFIGTSIFIKTFERSPGVRPCTQFRGTGPRPNHITPSPRVQPGPSCTCPNPAPESLHKWRHGPSTGHHCPSRPPTGRTFRRLPGTQENRRPGPPAYPYTFNDCLVKDSTTQSPTPQMSRPFESSQQVRVRRHVSPRSEPSPGGTSVGVGVQPVRTQSLIRSQPDGGNGEGTGVSRNEPNTLHPFPRLSGP